MPKLIHLLYSFVLIFSFPVDAQTNTNLEIFKILCDSLINEINNKCHNDSLKIAVSVTTSEDYAILKKKIQSGFTKNYSEKSNDELEIILETATVTYPVITSYYFFGKDELKREVVISGEYYFVDKSTLVFPFRYIYNDTITVEEKEQVESSAYPFTMAELPEEPLLENTLKPILILGAAAATIYLFFTIRSS